MWLSSGFAAVVSGVYVVFPQSESTIRIVKWIVDVWASVCALWLSSGFVLKYGGTIEVFYMDNSSPQEKYTVEKQWSLYSKLATIRAQITRDNKPDFKIFNHCKATYGELFTSMFNFKVPTATPSAPVDITASCSDDDE